MRRLILSSGRENRKGYTIPVSVIDVSDYLLNPVMLAEHNYDRVIGRMTDLRIEGDKLTGMPVFSSAGEGPKYQTFFEESSINACSMGGWVLINESTNVAQDFKLWELSMTAVPADPGAVAYEADQLSAGKLPKTHTQLTADAYMSKGYQYVRMSCDFEYSQISKNMEKEELKNEVEETLSTANEACEKELAAEEKDEKKEEEKDGSSEKQSEEEKKEEKKEEEAAEEKKEEKQTEKSKDEKMNAEKQETLSFKPGTPVSGEKLVNATAKRVSLSAMIKDKGMSGVHEMLSNGNDNEKLNVFDAIRRTPIGKAFFEVAHLNIDGQRVTVDQYLNNKESLSANLMQTVKLNASTDFIADPALDRIAFMAMAFLKLFPDNLWVNRMPVLPVQQVVDGVGTVWANIGFDSTITTQAAQYNSSVSPASITAQQDTPVSIQIYEHDLAPMLFRRYNEQMVAYDMRGLKLDVAMQNLFTAMYDWDLYTLATAVKANTIGTTGEAFTAGALWTQLPSPGNTTAYKGLCFNDIVSIEAQFAAQGFKVPYQNPVINIDPALNLSLAQDPIIQTRLTRFVDGEKSESLKVNYSDVYQRQYLGVWDGTSSAPVNPATGSPEATQVQYGLALIPEVIVRGLAGLEIYTKIEPTLYGEVYSAQIKTGIAPAYKSGIGALVIVPTQNA